MLNAQRVLLLQAAQFIPLRSGSFALRKNFLLSVTLGEMPVITSHPSFHHRDRGGISVSRSLFQRGFNQGLFYQLMWKEAWVCGLQTGLNPGVSVLNFPLYEP